MTTGNPWVGESTDAVTLDDAPNGDGPQDAAPSWEPQLGVEPPATKLKEFLTDDEPRLYVVGAHGGAGESALAGLLRFGYATDHKWPMAFNRAPRHTVVVARTSATGLASAQNAIRQWASGGAASVILHGLVLIADAPGRLPKELTDLARVVAGGVKQTWRVPWIEAWRRGEGPARAHSRRLAKTATDLDAIELHP